MRAGPLWRMELLTVPDFFRRKFGVTAEIIASCIMVPSYFGWIAAQFVALAGVLNLFFGIDPVYGLLLVAVVGTGYTLMGGMWSVTLTDAVQITLVLVGLLVLAFVTLSELGGGSLGTGFTRLRSETNPAMLQPFPTASLAALMGWIGVFMTGALGNLPGQDLMQRVFAAKSASTARWACIIAGVVYLTFGLIPLLLALAGNLLFPDEVTSEILPALAHAFLHPVVAVIFVVALLSAVLSTLDSAILSPASVLAENLLSKFSGHDSLTLNRFSVLAVALCSLGLAYAGTSAYELLEAAYVLTLVGLFVPLTLGLYSNPRCGRPAVAAMLVGSATWGLHFMLGWEHFLAPLAVIGNWEIPLSLAATSCSLAAYFCSEPPWGIAWEFSPTPEKQV